MEILKNLQNFTNSIIIKELPILLMNITRAAQIMNIRSMVF